MDDDKQELYLRQHVDEIVGPKHYEKFGEKLLVTNIFYTVQGEGPFAGCPAVFVRLAGCNRGDKTDYGCRFCDTEFTFARGWAMTVPEIIAAIEKERNPNVSKFIEHDQFLCVITGGEPMMQDNVWNLARALTDIGVRVQLESNGDRLAPGFMKDPISEMVLVVSPKIQAKRNGYGYFRPEVLERATCLKFLLDHRPESPYHKIPSEFLTELRLKNKTMVSPIQVYRRAVRDGETPSIWIDDLLDIANCMASAQYAAKFAMRHGLRVSLQTHLWLAMD